jgi:uncharacterized protein YjiS (DUF1127 family)
MIALLSVQNASSSGFQAFGRPLAALAGHVRQACAAGWQVRETLRRRREAAVLASFNDRMLADIGLTRGDVHDAFAEPPWRDPTAVLVARVRERRAARRRSVWPWPEPPRVPAPSIVPLTERCEAGQRVSSM